MSGAKFAYLADRALVIVGGEDAGAFLHNILTQDILGLAHGKARHAGLLTPQGKILFDMLVGRIEAQGFGLDIAGRIAPDIVKRLGFYKLRAKVTIADASASHRVGALWDGVASSAPGVLALEDTRHPGLGARLWMAAGAERPAGAMEASADAYHIHRIGLGIPEGGKDFPLGDTFPHEADMDLLDGVDFKKGCYVGQEVVSRMQHRGTARKRVVPVKAEAPLPLSGSEITAGAASIGTLGSVSGHLGLAMLRLDRAEEAFAKGLPLLAGGVPIALRQAGWLPFKLPGAAP